MERLSAYDWPGNVRELQNIVERAMVLANGPVLELESDLLLANPPSRRAAEPESVVPPPAAAGPASDPGGPSSLEAVGRQHILSVLERCGWVIEGPRGAAVALGLQPSTLRSRLKKLGLQHR
jgi:transcriptional regulator with GAF, ATPase, and Fis domain